MNNVNLNKSEDGLVNLNLDGGWELIEENQNYTSDYDMLVWELEKERKRINQIF